MHFKKNYVLRSLALVNSLLIENLKILADSISASVLNFDSSRKQDVARYVRTLEYPALCPTSERLKRP